MPAFFAWLFNSSIGKMLLNFLLNKLWKYITESQKDALFEEKLQKHIREKLAEYEKIIELANTLAKDGLSEDEKNEIRKRKIEIETSLVNFTNPTSDKLRGG